MKWLSAVTTSSILDLNFKQAFATVSQSREPINTVIFWIRSRILLWDFALTYNWETPQKNSPKGCSQMSWGARPPCPTPSGSSPWSSPATSCLFPTWVTSPHYLRFVPQVLWHHNSYCICHRNVHLLHQGPHGPAVVPGDELLRAIRQLGWSICGNCASCALFLFSLRYQQII